MLALLLTILIWGVIFYVLWWGLGAIAVPEPFHKIAVVVLVIFAVIVAIGLLTGNIGAFPIVDRLI